MLKHKLKTLQKEMKQISKSKVSGVLFVDLNLENEYIVRTSGDKKVIFKGKKNEFDSFKEKYSESVFIIDDIPKSDKLKRI